MDNLPIPQSRIENLMNAFISRDSGQISTPQSRVEEFWYHLIEGTNSLPIPQSRNELLLKKIIENDTHQIPLAQSRAEEFLVSILTGDTDKLPIPQSRSEYYLDYIARNNLVLDDIEYLKYNGTNITATNTVQKPFRSAILKGQTLVNLLTYFMPNAIYMDSQYRIQFSNVDNFDKITIVNKNSKTIKFSYYNNGWHEYEVSAFNSILVEIPKETDEYNIFALDTFGWDSTNYREAIDNIVLLHGDYANQDIPYFEGMQSVKMPVLSIIGKNIYSANEDDYLDNHTINAEGILTTTNLDRMAVAKFIAVKPNTTYYFSVNGSDIALMAIYGYVKEDENTCTGMIINPNIKGNRFTTGSNDNFIRIRYNLPKATMLAYQIQIEEGTSPTTYEPFKSNILTVNEDVTLRSNGSVCDELDLLTGKLTQRIDEDGEVLTQEVVKTVDLKVVDQDGNPVKQLSAFDETTHIVSSSASDNSLIAIAEVEVPTKLIEALNDVKSLSSDVEILINEVDNAQKLQDENSTIVMNAMTELYEIALTLGGDS